MTKVSINRDVLNNVPIGEHVRIFGDVLLLVTSGLENGKILCVNITPNDEKYGELLRLDKSLNVTII